MDKSIVPVDQIAVPSSDSYEFSNPNEAEVVELEDDSDKPVENQKSNDIVEIVERQIIDLKLDHQFDIQNVSQSFQDIVNEHSGKPMAIELLLYRQNCAMILDDTKVLWEKRKNDWLISYKNGKRTSKSNDLEKSVVNHLWFVFKNPTIKLSCFTMKNCLFTETKKTVIDLEKLSSMLQSMLDSIGHQIHTHALVCNGSNEDTFSSILQHCKPRVLEEINFKILLKEDGNCQKLERIVGMDQWKQAKKICSHGVSSLKIEDVLHCEKFLLIVSPENVPRVKEQYFNSSNSFKFSLHDNNGASFDDAMSQLFREVANLDSLDVKNKSCYKINKFDECLLLIEPEGYVFFHIF